jgi:hypothetical protein
LAVIHEQLLARRQLPASSSATPDGIDPQAAASALITA